MLRLPHRTAAGCSIGFQLLLFRVGAKARFFSRAHSLLSKCLGSRVTRAFRGFLGGYSQKVESWCLGFGTLEQFI